MKVVAVHQELERERTMALHESVPDVALNVGGLSQEIAELRHQGIEVDDKNEPAPENAQPNAPVTQTNGQWLKPTIFPRQADVNCHNTKGVWREHSWPKISKMTELSLFTMSFPEKWVKDVLIPATNKETSGEEITLKEFYMYLGYHLFMARIEGISGRRLWWSPKPVSIQEGSPLRLQKYMALRRLTSITSAMTFTNKPSTSFLYRFHDVRQMLNKFK